MTKKILLIITSFAFLFSCSVDEDLKVPDQETAKVSFSFSNLTKNTGSDTQAKSLADTTPKAIYMSISDVDGTSMLENPKLSLITFGNGYVTDQIELPVGNYEITTFNVLDENDVVIYASPMENSEYSSYVNNPLPISFSVTLGDTTTVAPEVIAVTETSTPEQFGYASFSFTVVDVPDVIADDTQELYFYVNETINGATQPTSGEFNLYIASQDYRRNGAYTTDLNIVELPVTSSNETVTLELFNSSSVVPQVHELSFDDITNSAVNPLVFNFVNVTKPTQTIYVNLINSTFSFGDKQVAGFYYYEISKNGDLIDAAEGNVDDSGQAIVLPTLAENEEVSFTFSTAGKRDVYYTFNSDNIVNYIDPTTPLQVLFEQEFLYVNMLEYNSTSDYWYNVQNGAFKVFAENDSFEGDIDQDVFPISVPYVFSNFETITLEFWGPGGDTYKKYEFSYNELSSYTSGADFFDVYLEAP